MYKYGAKLLKMYLGVLGQIWKIICWKGNHEYVSTNSVLMLARGKPELDVCL